jgi:hypothetical protein
MVRRNRPGLGVLFLSAGLAACLILYFFAPSQYAFYPKCVFHAMTGLLCPGCGSLRALHSLLHGELGAAWRLNPLLIVLLPVAGGMCLSYVWQMKTGAEFFAIFKRPVWIWLLLGLMVLFTVARNLPFGPLAQFRL